MERLALIGKNILHSRSQEMYEKLLGRKVDYTLLDFESESKLPQPQSLFDQYLGISITAPYKQAYLDKVWIDENVRELRAINCLRWRNERVEGTNTDYLALQEILPKIISDRMPIILGSGNMARVTVKVLDELNKSYKLLTRSEHGDLSYADLSAFNSGKTLILNCCSREFVFCGKISSNAIFYDFNYSFEPHNYLKSKIFKYIDGIELLFLQAKYALKFWEISS